MGRVSTAKVVRATHFAVMLFHGHLYREMGIVSKAEAERATHFAIMLSFLAGSGAVGMNLCAVSSDTDSAVKSHIVSTKSMLAEQTAPAAIALTDVSRSVSVFPFGDLDVNANQVCGDMSWTPPVSNVGFETYETYLATVAAGSGGVVVPDLWHWLEVHMWVVLTFEIFTIVIVSYRCREKGIVSTAKAVRATYIAVLLFFLTAVLGVGHSASSGRTSCSPFRLLGSAPLPRRPVFLLLMVTRC